jgi:putative FmdB family regulatory protein
MPIYAYRCSSCGFEKDVLQKISDAQLTDCPSCGQPEFKKQVTAAGFQLKGSGWYVTDFRNKQSATAGKAAATPSTSEPAAKSGGGTGGDSSGGSGGGSSGGGSDSGGGSSGDKGAAASGGSCKPGCGCH